MFTVSVIVPNYNNEKYLSTCLTSIISQTYPIKEIVIYDDCSTDRSKEILADFSRCDKRIKVIYGEKNVGVSAARDIAIRNTTSDYICMLDADDFFYSNLKIEKEMGIVEKIYNNTGKKVISFSQTIDVDEEGDPLEKPHHVNLAGNERFKIVTRRYKNYMPRDYCFPKIYYELCGGYTMDLSLFEDWELNMKLLKYTSFVYSGEYGTAYRHKSGGLSSVNCRKQLKVKKMIVKKYNLGFKERVFFYLIAYAAFIKNIVIGKRF